MPRVAEYIEVAKLEAHFLLPKSEVIAVECRYVCNDKGKRGGSNKEVAA